MRMLLIFPLLVCLSRGDPVAEADADAEAAADAAADADPIAQILYGQAGGPGSYQGTNYNYLMGQPNPGLSIEPLNQMNNPMPQTNWGDVYNNFETSDNSPPLMNNPMSQPEAVPIMSNPIEENATPTIPINSQGQTFTRSYTALPFMRPGQRCYNYCRLRPNPWPQTRCRPVCNVRPNCNTRRPWIDYQVWGQTVYCRPRRYPYYGNGGSGYNSGCTSTGGCGGSGYYGGSSGGSGYNSGCTSTGGCGGSGYYGGSSGGGGYISGCTSTGGCGGSGYISSVPSQSVSSSEVQGCTSTGGCGGSGYISSGSSQSVASSEVQVTEVN